MVLNRKFIGLLISMILLAFLLGAVTGEKEDVKDTEAFESGIRTYTEALALIEDQYVGSMDVSSLVEESIQRMLQTLDAHSSYATPRMYRSFLEDHTGSFYGIGITISIRNRRVTVISPMEGTPGYRIGLRPGDVIEEIDGVSTKGMTLNEAVSRMRGPEGEPVKITVRRKGIDMPLEFTVIRERIPLDSIPYYFMIDDQVGYIKLIRFSQTSEKEIKSAISDLQSKGMKKLILDLRDNPGGLLTQAISVSNIFLKEGNIVSVRGGNLKEGMSFNANNEKYAGDFPLAVMINDGSASASEILAGAVQDHDRGILIGEPTFGKGLVQSTFSLTNGGALYLTTARYYTPSGRLIQRAYAGLYDYYIDSRRQEKQATDNDKQLFKTDNGRPVYSGQGISPDIEAAGNLTNFVGKLIIESHFFNFAGEFVSRDRYISKNMKIDNNLLNEFKEYLKKKEVQFTEKDFSENESAIKMRLARDIFTRRWNDNEGVKASLEYDQQFQKAIKSINRAESLLALYNKSNKK